MVKIRSLVFGCILASAAAGAAMAQGWKSQYPELVMAVSPAENPSSALTRWTPVADYLGAEIGAKIAMRMANDYAAVIEGQRAGNVHIGHYGGAGYARAYITGVKTEPFAIEVNGDGTKGYYSVFYVKKDSPYQTLSELKGRNLALVDPNSTSGNNVPRFELSKLGIAPESFFNKVIYAGSHENAIIALQQGTVDVAADDWTSETESNLMRMDRKGMAKYGDYRIIHKSGLIMNPLMAYLSDLPPDLKARIGEAFFQLPQKNRALFDRVYDGLKQPWEPVDHKAYVSTIELIQFVDGLRKQRTN